MKKTLELSRPVFTLALAATLLLSGCVAQKDNHRLGSAPGPVFDTAEGIQAMPPCKAVVVERGPCFVYLSTPDGKGFYVGSPGSNAEVGRFINGLKDGRSYKFPEAFLKYQEQRRQAGQ
jgi:hypothetical protein